MTYPITPVPGLHIDPTAAEDARLQAQQTLAALRRMFSEVGPEIVQLIVNAILQAFGLSKLEGPIDTLLTALQTAMSNIPGGNIVHLVISDVQDLVSYLTHLNISGEFKDFAHLLDNGSNPLSGYLSHLSIAGLWTDFTKILDTGANTLEGYLTHIDHTGLFSDFTKVLDTSSNPLSGYLSHIDHTGLFSDFAHIVDTGAIALSSYLAHIGGNGVFTDLTKIVDTGTNTLATYLTHITGSTGIINPVGISAVLGGSDISHDLSNMGTALFNSLSVTSSSVLQYPALPTISVGGGVNDIRSHLQALANNFVNGIRSTSKSSASSADVFNAGMYLNSQIGSLQAGKVSLLAATVDFTTLANSSTLPAPSAGPWELAVAGPTTGGQVGISGGAATWLTGSTGPQFFLYPTVTGTDEQVVSVTISSFGSGTAWTVEIYGRSDGTLNNMVLATIDQTAVTIFAVNGGTSTQLATATGLSLATGTYSLVCGTSSGGRYYDLQCNGVSVIGGPINDSHPWSLVGVSYRYGGFGLIPDPTTHISPSLANLTISDNTSVLTAPGGPAAAGNANSGTTTSATYTNSLSGITGSLPFVTVTIGSSGMAQVMHTAQMSNSGAGSCSVGVSVNGGAPSDAYRLENQATNAVTAGIPVLMEGLTPGTNTFEQQCKVSSGTGTFSNFNLAVIPL